MNLLLGLRIVAVLYLFTAGAAIFQFARPAVVRPRVIGFFLGITSLLHLAVVCATGFEAGGLPIRNLQDDLSLFALLVALLSSVVGLRTRIDLVAPLAALPVGALMLVAFLAEPALASPVPAAMKSGWLPLHVASAFLGNAFFLMAGIVSLVYLLQERRLKGRKGKWVPRAQLGLPSLETLDQVSIRLIQFGFPLLTIGLVTGSIYGRQFWGSYWIWDVRNTLSVLIWLLYALLLHFRLTTGWRGRRMAMLTVAGVVATLISMVGLNLAELGTHGKDFLL